MVKDAISSGKGEKAMWRSVSRVDELLRDIEVEHPDMYWQFMRKAHEDMYGKHYTPEYAEYDLSRLRYTDDGGIQRSGPHWTSTRFSLPHQAEASQKELPTVTSG